MPYLLYMKDIINKMQEVLKEINNTEDIATIKENVIKGFEEITDKICEIEAILENMQNELYIDDCYDFDITCPYCNNEFSIEYDEEQTEVNCPECNNTIELNWTGDLEEDECSGNCSHCHGCDDEEEE